MYGTGGSLTDFWIQLNFTVMNNLGANKNQYNYLEVFNKIDEALNMLVDYNLKTNKNLSPSLAPDTLVPVGVKLSCKLSDISTYMPPLTFSMLAVTPLNTQTIILDAVTSEVVFDPLNHFIQNGNIQSFPTTSVSKSYVFYTNAIRTIPNLTADMLPIQFQQDRDSIDKIIFNSLDTVVNLYKLSALEKIIPQAQMFSSALSTDNANKFKEILNIVRFETIIYEKYSEMIEHFRN
jgi:hypothetical protein